jgi:hypothetical protein
MFMTFCITPDGSSQETFFKNNFFDANAVFYILPVRANDNASDIRPISVSFSPTAEAERRRKKTASVQTRFF